MTTPTCVLPAAALLGECPLWSADEQRLYWIDIDGRTVHRFDPVSGSDEKRTLAERPGSIALSRSGRLLVAAEQRLAWLEWKTGVVTEWIELEPSGTGNRLNDGRCDRAGRFWVGSMYDPAAANRFTGRLHRIEPDGSATTTRRRVGVANGLAFSPDGTLMYFADTLADTVWAFDYDVASGVVGKERVFLDFSTLPGHPDGACVDQDGCYWIACVYGSAILRVTPRGRVDRYIELPVEKPTMPAFGGPELDTMFVTTIGGGGSHPAAGQTDAGGLFAIDGLGTCGLAEPVFAD